MEEKSLSDRTILSKFVQRLAIGVSSGKFDILVVLLVFLIVEAAIFLTGQNRFQRFENEGQTVSATIYDLREYTISDEDGHRKIYAVCYRFPASASEMQMTINSCQEVSSSFFSSSQISQELEVVYIPADPKISSIKSLNIPPGFSFLTIAIAGIIIISIIFFNPVYKENTEKKTPFKSVFLRWGRTSFSGRQLVDQNPGHQAAIV